MIKYYILLPYNYILQKLDCEYAHLNLWYFVCFMIGMIVYFCLNFEPALSYIIFIILSLALITLIIKTNLPARFVLLLILSCMIGVAAGKFRTLNLKVSQIQRSVISNIIGTTESIKPTTTGIQITLKEVRVQKTQQPLSKVRLNVPFKYMSKISINDEISILAKIFKPRSSVLPGGYNFGFHAYFAAVGATGYAMAKPMVLKHSPKKSHIYDLRDYIYQRLVGIIGKERGNFAAAILLGETKGIDPQLMNEMRWTGISHILCVSGLHLSLVAMIFFISSRVILNLSNYISFKFNIRTIAAISSITGSYFYLELSGRQIAATRAFIMTTIFIIAIIIGRRPYPLRSIAIAAAFILSLNPEYIFHPSFQLSFIAVLSLISGYQFYLKNSWILGNSYGIIASLKLYLFSNIYSSFLASIITAPIVISHFYIFSTYSILMNLIAVPIMSFFLMPLGIISIVLMPVGWEEISLKLMSFFIGIIIKSAKFTLSLPGSVWYFGNISPISLITFQLGFFWISLWQTAWRLTGLPIMIISFIMMLNTKKPDLLFDVSLKAIGVKNSSNELVIYSNDQIPNFTRQYWANWWGQEAVQILPLSTYRYITHSGMTININYNDKDCKPADVQINVKANCKAHDLEINTDVINNGAVIAIYCNDEKCNYNYAKSRFEIK